MNKYQAKNENVIRNAFDRFSKNAENVIREGMRAMARAGLDYLIEAHILHDSIMLHTSETDTLGYAFGHDGLLIESGSHKGGDYDLPGSAQEEAEAILSGTKGWVIIILSDMEGWYRVDYEMDFLGYSAETIRRNFKDFFKPVAR